MTGQDVRDMDEALQVALRQLVPPPDPEQKNILLAHLFVRGGITAESDRSAIIGKAAVVGADCFLGYDYVALGHLHRPQEIRPHIRYCGTPLPYSFSEAEQQKHFLILETEDLCVREVPISPPYRLREEKGTLEKLKMQAAAQPSGDYLRLEVTDSRISKEDYEFFRQAYPNLLIAYSTAPVPGEETAVSPEQVEQLSAEAILEEFLQEQEGRSPQKEEIAWFLRAMEQAERGGLQ